MGIDYGNGKTNIDNKTGIRYGIISQNDVLQAWADCSEPVYIYACPYCGEILNDENPNEHPDFDNCGEGYFCSSCTQELKESDFDFGEPDYFEYKSGEYVVESDSNYDLWILKSPYFTYCGFCSPCAPGAGYLTDNKSDCKAYCLGHDFFEDGIAPYKVYSVKTGKEVKGNINEY